MSNDFLKDFEETINSECPVTLDMRLEDLPDWDSLAAMAFIAFAKREYNKNFKLADLASAITVRDLHDLLS